MDRQGDIWTDREKINWKKYKQTRRYVDKKGDIYDTQGAILDIQGDI